MPTAAIPAARPTARRSSSSWPISGPGKLRLWSYKVDRLTRSLADFAKLVELFDAHGVSFVSVTQQFNTTTSMGRLILNVLLSFAQFEREVTGERIRDKIAASKRKGLWVGGMVPLGYESRERRLVINEQEACLGRDIGIPAVHGPLNIHGTADGIHNGRKLNEDAIACGFHDPAAMERHGRVDQLAAKLAEALQRAFFIQSGQPGVAHHIGGQDGGELAQRVHGPSASASEEVQPTIG